MSALLTLAGGLLIVSLLVLRVEAAEDLVPGLFFSESFDDANLLDRGWYDGSKFLIKGEAYAGDGCIEYHWKQKGGGQVASSGLRHLIEPTDTVYLRFYIKFSPNWGWSGRSYHPHLTHFLTTENGKFHGPASSHLTLYIEPVNGKLRLGATDMQNVDAPHGLTQGPLRGGYNGKLYDSKQVVFNDADWHCVEAMFKLNTVDTTTGRWNRDGEIRGWFDGKLVVEHTDVVFRTVDFPEMKFNQFLMTPYFGPGLVPHPQALWIDELAVGTQRIGPLEKAPAGAPSQAEGKKPKALIIIAAGRPEPGNTRLEVDALSQAISKPGNTYVFTEALIEELDSWGVETQVLSYTQCRDLASLLPMDILVFAGPTHYSQLSDPLQELVLRIEQLSRAGTALPTCSALASCKNRALGSRAAAEFVHQLQGAGVKIVPGVALSASTTREQMQSRLKAFASALVKQL